MIEISTTKDKLLKASLEVFAEKGYELATTLEISKRAEMSEMTLFRHFKTKENLFNQAIRKTIGESLLGDDNTNYDLDLEAFLYNILDSKLVMMSNNKKVVRMLIRESLSNRLNDDLNFPLMIYKETVNKLNKFKTNNNEYLSEEILADYIVGFLLSQIIIEKKFDYSKMKKEDKESFISEYVSYLSKIK